MSKADQLRAELAAAELEDRLVQLKAEGADQETLQEAKVQLREARRVFRTMRDSAPPEDSADDATVRPEPVKATARAKGPGGKG